MVGVEIALPRQSLDAVEESLAGEGFAVDIESAERAVVVHGDATVIEQVAVVNAVQAACRKQEAHVLVEPLAAGE